ncbi:MAG: ribonuclease HI [Alphaproteobacteria bacterium]|nr:ribonuclease HI [Alphaproteobacteria bacterium]
MVSSRKKVTIYTDGACSGNPGPGGWAALLIFGAHTREISGGEAATTNNRMELLATIHALKQLKEPCDIALYTDSKYVLQGYTEWLAGWIKKGWKTADKKPVKNVDLWQALAEIAAQHKIQWHWVKGHSGDAHNDRVDALAVAQAQKLKRG